MANLVLEEGGSATWHLCWQAAMGREIFADAALYLRVQRRLLNAHQRQGRALVDYLMLPREIHVISTLQPGDSPGRVARAIGNVVSRWVQETLPVRSPVFAGPYRSMPISNVDELRHAARMFAWRPVVSGNTAIRRQGRPHAPGRSSHSRRCPGRRDP